ncbi:Glutathione import ATP-binding protein GsiA [Hyphomicrobiales bacterium]|nr:Glutathione import ATP-binding protein GsiA [Hyphomicrobiales bacterium]CAH1691815.1 Glutathione import ATP-binding protein GsiA [Hyphomicrobiales bacterium]
MTREDLILSVKDLNVRLPLDGDRVFGVQDVCFDVHAGQTLCIVGESGSGKSLTAQSILGLLPKRFAKPQGQIVFSGQNLLDLGPEALRRIRGDGIGMIFQEPMTALNPVWKIGTQLDEVLLTHRAMSKAERAARIAEIMAEVNLPAPELLQRYPHELSGGQRQRVMIAMALILEPKLLIADEPTTALDVTTQAQILKLIRNLQDKHGTGVLFITHDFGVVSDIADAVTVMQGGQVVESGAAGDVLRNPQHAYTRALIDAVPKGRFGAPRAIDASKVVLKVENLSKTYRRGGLSLRRRKGFKALHDVSLEIRGDEIVGLVGESGSGKSTVARCVSRLTDPDSGLIALNGTDLSTVRGSALRGMRRWVQVVFQDPYSSLNPRRTVGELIAQGLINFGMTKDQALLRAAEMLKVVNLEPTAVSRYPSDFSGGQRQRIGIARALAMEPQLLIADEAVSALDVSVQAQVLKLIRKVRDDLGLAVLFITHDLRVAAELCDRIVVMQHGRLVEAGTARDILINPQQDYTRQLIAAMPGQSWLNA